MQTTSSWIEKELIDSQSGFFDLWESAGRVDIYYTGIGWPLLATAINGFGIAANWNQRLGSSKLETLFEVIRESGEEFELFYIQNPDDAYSVVAWNEKRKKENVVSGLLDEFSKNPAEENGASFLGICIGTKENIVLFTYSPGDFFRISLYGDLKDIIPNKLKA